MAERSPEVAGSRKFGLRRRLVARPLVGQSQIVVAKGIIEIQSGEPQPKRRTWHGHPGHAGAQAAMPAAGSSDGLRPSPLHGQDARATESASPHLASLNPAQKNISAVSEAGARKPAETAQEAVPAGRVARIRIPRAEKAEPGVGRSGSYPGLKRLVSPCWRSAGHCSDG